MTVTKRRQLENQKLTKDTITRARVRVRVREGTIQSSVSVISLNYNITMK